MQAINVSPNGGAGSGGTGFISIQLVCDKRKDIQ
jgi:hypothetical protein